MSNYMTIAEADNYIASHYLSTDTLRASWEALTDEDKEVLLTVSTEAINSMPWSGKKTQAGQPNAFPRWPNTEVPKAVIAACIENALAFTDESTREESAAYQRMWAYGLSSYKIGNFSETVAQGDGNSGATLLAKNGIVSSKAQTMLKPFLGGGYRIE